MSSIEGIMTKDQWITDCNRHQNDFSDEIKNSSNPEDPIDDIPELLEEAPAETIWMKDGKAIVSTFGETVTSAQLDAFHRSGVSGIDQNRLDRFNRILDSSEPPKDIQPEAVLLPKIPIFDVSKRQLLGGLSFDVECVPGVYPTQVEFDFRDLYPNTMSKEEIDEAYGKASGQEVTFAQTVQRMVKDINDSHESFDTETITPLPLPDSIKKEMLGALTLGMSAETVIKTLLQMVIDNQARGVDIDCYKEDLEKFSKGAAKFLESPGNENGAPGFGFKFGRLFSGLVEHLNTIKLSTTATELNRDLVSFLLPPSEKISPELIIVIGFIVRQYRKYVDLVEGLLRDFFYVAEKQPFLHDLDSLVMGMEAAIVGYHPGPAPRYVDMSGMSEELRSLFGKGNEMIDQSLKSLQESFDREGKESLSEEEEN